MTDPIKALIGTALFQCRYLWKDNPGTYLTFPEQRFLESKTYALGESLISQDEQELIKALPYQERNHILDELSLKGASLLSDELQELFEVYRYNKRRRQWFTTLIAYVLMAVKFGYFDAKQSMQFRQRALRLEEKIARQSFNVDRDIIRGDALIDNALDALFPNSVNGAESDRASTLARHMQFDGACARSPVIAPLLHR